MEDSGRPENRTWLTAEQDPAVADRGHVAELPCPEHAVWRKTCPACREIPVVTDELRTAELEAARKLVRRFQAAGINAAPGVAGSVVLYASDIEAEELLGFLEARDRMNQYVARTGLPRPWHEGLDWTGWVRLDEVRDALAALNSRQERQP